MPSHPVGGVSSVEPGNTFGIVSIIVFPNTATTIQSNLSTSQSGIQCRGVAQRKT